jgi:selenocysteine lyase/cysteine desulfurase
VNVPTTEIYAWRMTEGVRLLRGVQLKREFQEIPDYRNPATGGSMIRAACWLASEVGEGGIFTKEELRDALPGVAQIDRRVRDLRKHGWVIEEARQGAGLVANQQRLATIGTAVWDKEARMAAPISVISAKVREEVFFRDGHACRRCGIAAGEVFDDDASSDSELR